MTETGNYDPKIVGLFRSFDLDANNTLDKHELSRGLSRLIKDFEPNLDDDKLEKMTKETIEVFDLNKNGKLEIDEFNKLIQFLVDEKGLEI